MAVAINTPINIVKTLPAGVISQYVDVSLYVSTASGVTTIYNTTVINSTLTVAGSLTATGVSFPSIAAYKCTFNSESNADLDVNAVVLTPIASLTISIVTIDSIVTF